MVILKRYLTINSIFSAVSGIIMLLIPDQLNSTFGINNPYVFPIIGLNLIVFSVFVFYVSRRQITNRTLINLISGLDALWVLGSLLIIILGLFDLSKIGHIIIGVVAVWIAFLGYNQFKNSRE